MGSVLSSPLTCGFTQIGHGGTPNSTCCQAYPCGSIETNVLYHTIECSHAEIWFRVSCGKTRCWHRCNCSWVGDHWRRHQHGRCRPHLLRAGAGHGTQPINERGFVHLCTHWYWHGRILRNHCCPHCRPLVVLGMSLPLFTA